MSARIEDLEPVTRGLCVAFLAACETNSTVEAAGGVRVTHTLRTLDEQMHLYAKGRVFRDGEWAVTDKRQVVTNAKPGQSAHNYGAAFDICFNGHEPYPSPMTPEGSNLWKIVGAIGERVGLAWGGSWVSIQDRPHFERRDWKTLRTPTT